MAKKEKKFTETEVGDLLHQTLDQITEKPAETLEIAAPKMQKTLEMLVASGIPVEKATFHAAVSNADGTPEHQLLAAGQNKSRTAKMWWTPHTLICWQKGIYFGTPLANVISVKFL